MGLLLAALGVLIIGGAAAVATSHRAALATACGAGTAVIGCVVGLTAALPIVLGAADRSLRVPWQVPYGTFAVAIDPLSAFFLVPIFLLGAAAAVYGAAYLWPSRFARPLGAAWGFYNLLIAAMVLVVIARNGVLFVMAWEVMTLASFFLVTREDDREESRQAGWTYLVAAHLGTTFLLALFALLGRDGATLDFDRFSAAAAPPSLLFLLAVVGFGTKAGFMPLHVWLPEAHPAAPSHVSAVMSGVMIKTGIYGLLRVLTFLGPPPAWWGWLLCGVGLTSGVGGVLFALAQHDLKRLLAYHSVENIGIIALGVGVGLLGVSSGSPALAVLGFAGALLHVANHACFKGLLFLGAGAVGHATGTREIDQLGGLLKRMPWTGAAFLTGAAAISGLPPLNGFISEWLIFVGSLRGVAGGAGVEVAPFLAVIGGLALIGGLAAACFTKAFGIVFLGEARSERVGQAHEPGLLMRVPMLLLAGMCFVIGLFAPLAMRVLGGAVAQLARLSVEQVHAELAPVTEALMQVARTGIVLLVLAAGLAGLRRWLLHGRQVIETVTWDCGYARPSPRMQYTASSFAQPLTELFRVVLRTRAHLVRAEELFPQRGALTTHTADVCTEQVYRPLFAGIDRGLSALRWLQHGRVHLYVLYITLTLLVLLLWKLG